MGKVILVASGKGGTGKTMFSVNMGATLAQRGYNVLLIDMDMGLRNMDLYLGMENRVVYNIMDVLSGICRISKAIIRVDGFSSLYFMAAAPRLDERDITPLHMAILCAKLREVFDYIIIDCPAGIGEMLEVSLEPADKAVIVTEPEFAASRACASSKTFVHLPTYQSFVTAEKVFSVGTARADSTIANAIAAVANIFMISFLLEFSVFTALFPQLHLASRSCS